MIKYTKKTYKLFNIIPLLKVENKYTQQTILLFGFIPLIKIKGYNKIDERTKNLEDDKNINPYIYDNPNDKQIYPNMKILVAYHKPAQLFQHKILLPIHLGRKVAKETATTSAGTFTNNDVAVKWLHDNMIGDDTGDNISDLNRQFNEMTGIYWAWKNYDKIGNPDYIGSYHYARLFTFDIIKDVANYDMIVAKDYFWKNYIKKKISVEDQLLNNIFEKMHPNEYKDFTDSIKIPTFLYSKNMFIMKKELFFEYCEWLFPILFEIQKNIEKDGGVKKYETRCVGLCAEHLTSYFLWKKAQDKSIKWKETEKIEI
ncbi:MAG: hypothetical protein Ta2D_12930 [Rickettsiales bacterium]|nr:MAG: hypothetical protein Ta2D_12930 [Rickettsiales bacterium]